MIYSTCASAGSVWPSLRTLLLLCPLQGEGLPRKDKNEGGHPALYKEVK